MKICIINNLYKPYDRGGAERVAERMAEDYLRQGHEVIIIATRPRLGRKKTAEAEAATGCERLKIYYLPGIYYRLSSLPLLARLAWHFFDMYDFCAAGKIKKILEKEKPGEVITHNLKGISYLIPRILKQLKIKHTHYLHDIQLLYPSGLLYFNEEKKIDGRLARLYQKLCSRLFNSPDSVISPSGWLMKWHTDKGFFKNSKLIIAELKSGLSQQIVIGQKAVKKSNALEKSHNNVTENKTKKIDQKLKRYEKEKKFRFLFVGQVEEHKGVGLLIQAFNGLKNKNAAELVIVGQGSGLAVIQKEIKSGQDIIVMGKRTAGEVRQVMESSDILVVPSLCFENAPAVILEAAEVGLPVLAARIGGIPELIERFGGQLFEPGNKDELKELMNKFRHILDSEGGQ